MEFLIFLLGWYRTGVRHHDVEALLQLWGLSSGTPWQVAEHLGATARDQGRHELQGEWAGVCRAKRESVCGCEGCVEGKA